MSATLLSDTFTDADGTALASHTMDVGSGWTAQTGTYKILTNSCVPNSNNDADIATCDAGAADFVLTCTITPYNSGANESSPQVIIRFQDTSNYWVVHNTSSGGACNLYEILAGSVLLKQSSLFGFTSGISYSLKIVCNGAAIFAYVNGTLQISYTTATDFQTKTKVGFRLGKNGSPATACVWDTLLVQQSTGDAVGSATVSGVGSGGSSSWVGVAAGKATVAGVGAPSFSGVGASSGSATAVGVGRSTFSAVAASYGLGTVAAVSESGVAGVAASIGVATISGVGASGLAGVGAATGAATVAGVGASAKTGVAAAAGTATVSGVGVSQFAGAGSATGVALTAGLSAILANRLDDPYRPARLAELRT